MNAHLNLGPVLFNWSADTFRDFYFRMADEAPLETVFLGEVVCSKREPFFAPELPAIAERLTAAGKKVVFSTLALVMTKRERDMVQQLCEMDGVIVEANDISAVSYLQGRPHTIGPFVNIYNEGSLAVMEKQGATHISLPGELPRSSLQALAKTAKADLEVQAFGRQPLAVSARCYHARSHGLAKDSCQYVCAKDPDGMDLDTLDGDAFLAVNGIQTMSYTCANLIGELDDLQTIGIHHFRLSPHSCDMVDVTKTFEAVLKGQMETGEAVEKLNDLMDGLPFSNGYYYGQEGAKAKGMVEEFGL